MNKRGKLWIALVVFLTVFVLSSFTASALTGVLGNSRQTITGRVGDTIERQILLRNDNTKQVTADISNTNTNIQFVGTHFILSSGEEKIVKFKTKIVENGETTYDYNVIFSQGGQSVSVDGHVTTTTGPLSTDTVAYIYRKKFKIDYNAIEVFEELGLSVELIDEKTLPRDFSKYRLIYLGDEKYQKSNLIPINSYPSIVTNYYHGEEYGLTDREGISKLASAKPLSVLKNGHSIQVYTKSDGLSMPSIGYYFIDMENEADALETVALTEETSSGAKFGDVIAYADRGSRMENGRIQGGNLCFFGISESDYWTPQAKQMFKDCAGFVASECMSDNDCSAPEYSAPFCQDGDVYQIKTSYTCDLVQMYQCVPHDNATLVEDCQFGCSGGACLAPVHDVALVDFSGAVDKVKIEGPNGVVGAGDKLLCNKEYNIITTAKNLGQVTDTIILDFNLLKNSASNGSSSAVLINVTPGESRVYDRRVLNLSTSGTYVLNVDADIFGFGDANPSDNNASRTLQVICPVCSYDSDCNDNNSSTQDVCHNPGEENAACTHENIPCFTNADCGIDGFVDGTMCNANNDVTQKYIYYVCNNAGTPSSYCSSSNETRVVDDCADLCENGMCVTNTCDNDTDCDDSNPLTYDQCLHPGTVVSQCVNTEVNCASDLDCGFTGFLGNEFCSTNDTIKKNFQNATCQNPGTLNSSCSLAVAPQTIAQCEFACGAGSCIRCDQNIDCDDGNPSTVDICLSPGTAQSQCSNDFQVNEITCTKNSDCGADTPLMPLFCSNSGDSSQLVVTHICNNANTTQSYCATQTVTKTLQVCDDSCQNGACVNINCYNNADCTDNNNLTNDICHNAGTPQSFCTHENIPVTCYNNGDCDDGNSWTDDICHNAGTPSSYCTHENTHVACYSDGQCGTDGYVGENFCSNGDVYRLYKDYECNAAGTPLSFCSNDVSPKLLEQCQYGCGDGECQPQQTVECSFNSQCGTNALIGDPFCQGNDIYRNYQSFLCLSPGTTSSSCTSNVQALYAQTCQYACADSTGTCVRCDSDSDCNDWNAGTSEVCVLPDSPLSYCKYTPVGECSPGQTRDCGVSDVGECSVGTQTCNGQGYWGTCSGAVLPETETCDGADNDCDGLTDEGGVCGPSCSNECTFGARQCSNGGVIACGDFDNDPCTEWSSVYACDTGESCSNGECVPDTPSCNNECTFGTRECYNGGTRMCGQFDGDPCMEWSAAARCSTDEVCQNGYCM